MTSLHNEKKFICIALVPVCVLLRYNLNVTLIPNERVFFLLSVGTVWENIFKLDLLKVTEIKRQIFISNRKHQCSSSEQYNR
jgi:hypothetical protein